jgi:hypothetical protein
LGGKGLKKGRAAGNPLHVYRRTMREIRAVYDPFTAKHCASCETPCCMRPSRLTPLDVSLATAVGHSFPHLGKADPFTIALDHAEGRLSPTAIPLTMLDADASNESGETPCEFLHKFRCTFPDDLRPFGCTTYICKPMYAHMADADLRKLKRLIAQLSDAHAGLLRAMK